MSSKYVCLTDTKTVFRLTLTREAFILALSAKSKWAGVAAYLREDGQWDCCVPLSSAHLLKQVCDKHENLSDAVVRLLSPPAAKPATTGGQDGA